MKLNKYFYSLPAIALLTANLTGCTAIKEMFLSDITKDLCEQKEWSAVGVYALDNGKDMDSFHEYQTQCNKYFGITISNDMIDSFTLGYEKAKPSYCTTEKALSIGQICGYYNVHACKSIVSEELLMDLFEAFQQGNNTCISNTYSNGEFAGKNSVTCL